MTWCVRSLVMEPVDALLQRLQWLDEQGHAMSECLIPQKSPFSHCISLLQQMVVQPCNTRLLGPLHATFASGDLGDKFHATTLQLALSLIAEVLYSFQYLSEWPFALFKMADRSLSQEALREVAQAFQDATSVASRRYSATLFLNSPPTQLAWSQTHIGRTHWSLSSRASN